MAPFPTTSSRLTTLMRLLREPFLQFLLIGGLVFLVYSFSTSQESTVGEKKISIDEATQQWLHSNFAKQFRRPPTKMEMGSLIKQYTTNEVKYREAVAMGLDVGDSIVRRRMMQKVDFLFGNAAGAATPDDDMLAEWYAENPDEFRLPPTITFDHVWFSPDRRGTQTQSDARSALEEIAVDETLDQVMARGDRFPFDVAFVDATYPEVRNVLGELFANQIFTRTESDLIDKWTGPIRSGLGFHLVRIQELQDGEQPPLDDVRDAVVEVWRRVESQRLFHEMIVKLQGEYDVTIDEQAMMRWEYTPESAAIQVGFGADD